MFIEQEQREFLGGLQVGDLVCVVECNDWIVSAVTRTTDARIWVGSTKFDRKTGRELGSGTSFYRGGLRPLTPERIELARVEVEQRKEQAARKVLLADIEPVLRSAPLHVLEQVRALLAKSTEEKR